MGTPFLAELRIISWTYAPKGWAFCNGQFLPINQNQALFSLLGTTYGGNGQTTFALPDLRGRTPIHRGDGFAQGQAGGQTAHTITQSELPAHNLMFMASDQAGTQSTPVANTSYLAKAPANTYADPANASGYAAMNAQTVSNTGGGQPHTNMQPYLVLNFVIALIGIFPSHN